VGTDSGVYRGYPTLINYQPSWNWQPYSAGLPLVQINDLIAVKLTGELRAATWGRGVWSVKPHWSQIPEE
jgi:hypothetical protein